jgi:Cdc6-like AAA superfamily ATPase
MISEFDANKSHLIEDGNLLSTEAMVDEPVGRQAEIERLKTSLAPMLRGQPPLNAWVCGPPGCGKTLLAQWAVQATCGSAATRVGVYVNCWQHRSLHSVLGAIIGQLKILGAEAQDTNVKLDRVRQALRARPFVVILDEIDRPMPAQREEIIYGLLGLPRCALVCIAKGTQALAAMDEGVRSRLSPVVIQLAPYLAEELEAILTDRAQRALAPDSWTPAVLKRIAAEANGDARVAIQVLRQATAAAEMSGNTKLTPRLVERCLRPWRLVQQEARLAGLSEHEKILFEQVKQHGPLGASELARRYIACCQGRNIRPMARRTFTKYLGRLSAAGLLETSGQQPGPGGRIVRAITADP